MSFCLFSTITVESRTVGVPRAVEAEGVGTRPVGSILPCADKPQQKQRQKQHEKALSGKRHVRGAMERLSGRAQQTAKRRKRTGYGKTAPDRRCSRRRDGLFRFSGWHHPVGMLCNGRTAYSSSSSGRSMASLASSPASRNFLWASSNAENPALKASSRRWTVSAFARREA